MIHRLHMFKNISTCNTSIAKHYVEFSILVDGGFNDVLDIGIATNIAMDVGNCFLVSDAFAEGVTEVILNICNHNLGTMLHKKPSTTLTNPTSTTRNYSYLSF